MSLVNTPVETYYIGNKRVYVKREDLCVSTRRGAPPFAKIRGLLPTLHKLKKENITTVGYMQNSISMAGWGISYFAKKLDIKVVIFMPKYKEGLKFEQQKQLEIFQSLGAKVEWFENPNRQKINFYITRNILKKKYKNSYMLPLGLMFKETVEELRKEIENTQYIRKVKSIVISVGSGMMISGVVAGCNDLKLSPTIYGIFIDPKSERNMEKHIYKTSKTHKSGLLSSKINLKLIDDGYEYTQKENVFCGFPCNPYYDLKAWAWLIRNIKKVEHPTMFWNIGA